MNMPRFLVISNETGEIRQLSNRVAEASMEGLLAQAMYQARRLKVKGGGIRFEIRFDTANARCCESSKYLEMRTFKKAVIDIYSKMASSGIEAHEAISKKIALYGVDKFEKLDNETKHKLVQKMAANIPLGSDPTPSAPIVEQAPKAKTKKTKLSQEDGKMAKAKLTVELSYPEKELLKAVLTNEYQDGPGVIDTPVWAWSIECFETPRILESTAKHLANKGFITVDGDTSAKETQITVTKEGFLALYQSDPEAVEGFDGMLRAGLKSTKLLLKDFPEGLPEVPAKEDKATGTPAKKDKKVDHLLPAKESKVKKEKVVKEPKERKVYEHQTPRLFKSHIKCCQCRKENHADHDAEIEMTLFISPTTNRPEMRGFTCAKHRQIAMADGWTVRMPGKELPADKPVKAKKVIKEVAEVPVKAKKAKPAPEPEETPEPVKAKKAKKVVAED